MCQREHATEQQLLLLAYIVVKVQQILPTLAAVLGAGRLTPCGCNTQTRINTDSMIQHKNIAQQKAINFSSLGQPCKWTVSPYNCTDNTSMNVQHSRQSLLPTTRTFRECHYHAINRLQLIEYNIFTTQLTKNRRADQISSGAINI